jgi:Ca2+:H+ antiporter
MVDAAESPFAALKGEWILIPILIAGAAASFYEEQLRAMGAMTSLIVAVVLVAAIIAMSVRVAHHAEVLAAKVGDPYGSMILTLSAVLVEVVVLVILMADSENPTLARDTIFSAVMLDINGIIGLAALLGGYKYGVQPYNDASGKTYGSVILTAMGISMVIPEFIPHSNWEVYSVFSIIAMITLYWVFLRNQIGPHSYFFSYSYPDKKRSQEKPLADEPLAPSLVLLVGGIVVVGLLAEVMSAYLGDGLSAINAPLTLAAVVVAAISAAPEILTALRAALHNRMQVVINIALGASLSTVVLTVPVIEAIALYTGQPIIMAMTPVQIAMAAVTLVVAAINLNDGKTNAIEGMTHLVLFGAFAVLVVLGVAAG